MSYLFGPQSYLQTASYCLDTIQFLLEPLFFASIGFAVPFLDLWTGKEIWRGVVFTLLMLFGKAIVGIWILIWPIITHHSVSFKKAAHQNDTLPGGGLPFEKTTYVRPKLRTRRGVLRES